MSTTCRKFTFVELLVVIFICSILVALLWPIKRTRSSHMISACFDHLKASGTQMLLYAEANQNILPTYKADGTMWFNLPQLAPYRKAEYNFKKPFYVCPVTPLFPDFADRQGYGTADFADLPPEQRLKGETVINGDQYIFTTLIESPETYILLSNSTVLPGSPYPAAMQYGLFTRQSGGTSCIALRHIDPNTGKAIANTFLLHGGVRLFLDKEQLQNTYQIDQLLDLSNKPEK